MPTTTKKRSSGKKRSEFQRMITPEEMRDEMRTILRSKRETRAFLRRIGVVFKKNGQIEVKPV